MLQAETGTRPLLLQPFSCRLHVRGVGAKRGKAAVQIPRTESYGATIGSAVYLT